MAQTLAQSAHLTPDDFGLPHPIGFGCIRGEWHGQVVAPDRQCIESMSKHRRATYTPTRSILLSVPSWTRRDG